MHLYNAFMLASRVFVVLAMLAISAFAQQSPPEKPSPASRCNLPKASLWGYYSFLFQSGGSSAGYRWRLVNGALPRGLSLQEQGDLSGEVSEQGQSNFTIAAIDSSGRRKLQHCVLVTESPLIALWSNRAQVNANRIDGSIKVSNTTGRDLDLTFVVLAVNDLGRATAIGYQRFPLKRNTRDFELPFGETLAPGNYTINVDVIGEEPQSQMIFRSRMVTANLAINPSL